MTCRSHSVCKRQTGTPLFSSPCPFLGDQGPLSRDALLTARRLSAPGQAGLRSPLHQHTSRCVHVFSTPEASSPLLRAPAPRYPRSNNLYTLRYSLVLGKLPADNQALSCPSLSPCIIIRLLQAFLTKQCHQQQQRQHKLP